MTRTARRSRSSRCATGRSRSRTRRRRRAGSSARPSMRAGAARRTRSSERPSSDSQPSSACAATTSSTTSGGSALDQDFAVSADFTASAKSDAQVCSRRMMPAVWPGGEPHGEIEYVLFGDEAVDVADDVAQRRKTVVVTLDLDDDRCSVITLGDKDGIDDADGAAIHDVLQRRQDLRAELTSGQRRIYDEFERRRRHGVPSRRVLERRDDARPAPAMRHPVGVITWMRGPASLRRWQRSSELLTAAVHEMWGPTQILRRCNRHCRTASSSRVGRCRPTRYRSRSTATSSATIRPMARLDDDALRALARASGLADVAQQMLGPDAASVLAQALGEAAATDRRPGRPLLR